MDCGEDEKSKNRERSCSSGRNGFDNGACVRCDWHIVHVTARARVCVCIVRPCVTRMSAASLNLAGGALVRARAV